MNKVINDADVEWCLEKGESNGMEWETSVLKTGNLILKRKIEERHLKVAGRYWKFSSGAGGLAANLLLNIYHVSRFFMQFFSLLLVASNIFFENLPKFSQCKLITFFGFELCQRIHLTLYIFSYFGGKYC